MRTHAICGQMLRSEAVALLKELDAQYLIKPSMVLVEQRKPDSYELRLKGFYNLELIKGFTKKYNLECEEDLTKGYLCIFTP